MIHFAHPWFWNGMLAVLLIALMLVFLAKRRRKVFHRFGDKKLSAVTAWNFLIVVLF